VDAFLGRDEMIVIVEAEIDLHPLHLGLIGAPLLSPTETMESAEKMAA
jgi:hypothetical protein